jgi:hypothetical protein
MRADSNSTISRSKGAEGLRGLEIWQLAVSWRAFAAIAGSLPLAAVLLAKFGS